MSRLERYKLAKIIGPGTWYAGHSLTEKAAESKDPKDFDIAYGYIQHIRMYFLCGKCRGHMNEFWMSNNPERFLDTKDAEGLSNWWYDLHNNADEIAGNPTENREDVRKFFRTEAGLCDLNCDKDDTFTVIDNPIVSNVRKSAPGIHLYSKMNADLKSNFTDITSYAKIKR